MKNADQPIHPDPMRGTGESYYNQSPDKLPCGLTKREHFAGLALQGMLSNPCFPTVASIDDFPRKAVSLAEELLKALEDESND